MAAQGMVLPNPLRHSWSMIWLFIQSVAAANLGRSAPRNVDVSAHMVKGHVAVDDEPTVLDFSDSPFTDSILNLADSDPFGKANPKNGTPWFRYTKKAGRGRANHSHFGGLTATGDFPEDILHAHNVVRERAGIQPIEWHNGLHELAAARVAKLANEGCYIKHSPLSDRWGAHGFQYIGENLYKVINMKPTGVDIVDAWYAELEDYTFGTVGSDCVKEKCAGRTSPPCTLGHFTQVQWEKSTHVGCARAECPDQSKRTFVAVCNYGPGGNIVGRYPFTAANSKAMGLSTQDCRYRPKPEPTAWDDIKEGKVPHQIRSSGWRQASAPLTAALFALAALYFGA